MNLPQRHVGQTGTPVAAAFSNLVNAGGKDTVTNLRPVHGVYVCVDAQVLDLAGLLRDGRRVDVHFGGDAANVQAGAAEDTAVDEGDLLVVPFGADEGVAGSGADDDEVVLGYPVDAFQVFDAHDDVEAGLVPSVPLDDGLISVTATITCMGGTLFPLSRVNGDGYAKVRLLKDRSTENIAASREDALRH